MPTTATPTRPRADLSTPLTTELDTPRIDWWTGSDGRTAHRAATSDYPQQVIPATSLASSGSLRSACTRSTTTFPAHPRLTRCTDCLG